MKIESHGQFRRFSAYYKGYAVYALGERDDEPHVPKTYTPSAEDREEYDRGQREACIEAMDTEG